MLRHLAYLDPGTGSIIIQALIGFLAGIALFARRFFGSIKRAVLAVFRKLRKPKPSEPETDDEA